ncbi:hypothetical protein Tco_1233903 [Tanacetum coccineum]
MQVMAASVISISSNLSEESVGSHAPRVILFSVIPAIIPIIPEVPIVPTDPIVALEVGAVSVVSPTEVLDLVDYSSSSGSDPSKDSFPLVPDLPLVSPFLCSNDSEADRSHLGRPDHRDHHLMILLNHHLSFPLLLLFPHPGFIDDQQLLSDPRVGPIPARRLAWRCISHHSSDHHSLPDVTLDSSSSSSSSDSSSDSSSIHSSGCDSSSLAYSGPSTRVVSPRSTPLSTPYPPTTSESSLGSSSERLLDSSSPYSGPSCKICRSPTASVPSSTHISRSIAHTPADLLPPRKRFRDLYLHKDSGEEHMETGTANAAAVTDLGIDEGVGAPTEDGIAEHGLILSETVARDEIETDTRDIVDGGDDRVTHPGRFHDHTVAIPVHRKQIFESVQRFQGHRIVRVDLGFTIMADRFSALEQDNTRL